MIEQLERRLFCSTTPIATLSVLRADVAGIGQTLRTMIAANKSAIANLNHDQSVFRPAFPGDIVALQQLNDQFNSQLVIINYDFTVIKSLYGQDITNLIDKTNSYNRHPTGSAGLAVTEAQQLFESQGDAVVANFPDDFDQLQQAYLPALDVVAATHPLDATLSMRVDHITDAFNSNIQVIESTTETIAGTDIPNFINALEPSGIAEVAAVARG